jgi:hypothetical protein
LAFLAAVALSWRIFAVPSCFLHLFLCDSAFAVVVVLPLCVSFHALPLLCTILIFFPLFLFSSALNILVFAFQSKLSWPFCCPLPQARRGGSPVPFFRFALFRVNSRLADFAFGLPFLLPVAYQ